VVPPPPVLYEHVVRPVLNVLHPSTFCAEAGEDPRLSANSPTAVDVRSPLKRDLLTCLRVIIFCSPVCLPCRLAW
jgi:hypothetical protein